MKHLRNNLNRLRSTQSNDSQGPFTQGSRDGRDDSIAIHQDVDLWLGKLEAADRVTYPLAEGRHSWLQVAEGELTVNGQVLGSGDAMATTGVSSLEIEASGSSRLLLFDLS